jgi:hypothetical protein
VLSCTGLLLDSPLDCDSDGAQALLNEHDAVVPVCCSESNNFNFSRPTRPWRICFGVGVVVSNTFLPGSLITGYLASNLGYAGFPPGNQTGLVYLKPFCSVVWLPCFPDTTERQALVHYTGVAMEQLWLDASSHSHLICIYIKFHFVFSVRLGETGHHRERTAVPNHALDARRSNKDLRSQRDLFCTWRPHSVSDMKALGHLLLTSKTLAMQQFLLYQAIRCINCLHQAEAGLLYSQMITAVGMGLSEMLLRPLSLTFLKKHQWQ